MWWKSEDVFMDENNFVTIALFVIAASLFLIGLRETIIEHYRYNWLDMPAEPEIEPFDEEYAGMQESLIRHIEEAEHCEE